MEDTIISFETALLAKDLGYPQESTKLSQPYYNHLGELNGDVKEYIKARFAIIKKTNNQEITTKFDTIRAMSQSLLQKWLREKHDILIYIEPKSHHYFQYHIITSNNEIISSYRSNKWELTLEKGLQEALKLIKL